jgi:hypothetical protein
MYKAAQPTPGAGGPGTGAVPGAGSTDGAAGPGTNGAGGGQKPKKDEGVIDAEYVDVEDKK